MVATIWRFRVAPALTGEFERIYGPAGDWATLFAEAPGYAGTELMRLDGEECVYLTIDRWSDAAAFRAAKSMLEPAYSELDRRCEAYTLEECWLGLHTIVDR